jgi:hypothetical protein
MPLRELETIINRLVQLPLKNQMVVDFDKEQKTFRLSAIIYRAPTNIPLSLKKYVQNLDGMTFRPHKTSYRIEDSTVHLIQEFPFHSDCGSTLRNHTIEFWRLARYCNQMLSEIAAEES